MTETSLPRPPWRRRVGVYLLICAGALLLVHFLDLRPLDVQLAFSLNSLDVRVDDRRLDRDELVELAVEIRDGEESLARSTMSFAPGAAPMRTRPVAVRLRAGDYDAHFRLAFEDGQERRTFALRRRFSVEDAERPVVVEVR